MSGTSEQAPLTRRRGSALTRAIYLTTLEELARTSFEELSFDKIAAKAGAGKASLYRRWSTPAELVLAALTDPVSGFPAVVAPGTGSLRGDLTAVLSGFGKALDEPHGRALRPLMTQRPRHPELYEEVFRRVVEPHQDMLLLALRDAVGRGEADPAAPHHRIATVGLSLVIMEHIQTGELTRSQMEGVVDDVMLPLAAPSARD